MFLHLAVIYLISMAGIVCWSAKLLSCAGQILAYHFVNMHPIMLFYNQLHWSDCQWEIKIYLLHRDPCERHIYLFPLSAEGHCFHDDSLMASFASLFLICFSLHSLHICNISVCRPFMTVAGRLLPSPLSILYFSSLTPHSLSLSL